MLRKFFGDVRGNYGLATVIAMLPIMGGVSLAVDYAEMNRQRQAVMNALDAAAVATARHAVGGADDAELITYANDFFVANLGPVAPRNTDLDVILPTTDAGGGTLRMSARLGYDPRFYPVFAAMLGNDGDEEITFDLRSEVKLKNTIEVALVLDNSGSMDYNGDGSGQKRIDLLKMASKKLVDTLAAQAEQMRQVE